MQGPHSRAVPCPICHEKFFPASLPFHQKQCEKRQSKRIVPCPYCGTEVAQITLADHVSRCPKGAKKRGGSQGPKKGSVEDHSAALDMGPGQFDPEVRKDGRMRCIYCGRYFNSDRIDKHQGICGKLKNARPSGVDGQPTQTGRKVFNSEAQRLGSGSCFISADEAKRREKMKQKSLTMDRQARATEPVWRRQHEEWQSNCRAGRTLDQTMPKAKTQPSASGGITCPHCSRHFDQKAADRHIPICAKVINRPRPPPTGSREPSPQRGTPRSQGSPARPGSSASRTSDAGPSGGGLQAVRGLRQYASTDRLPTAKTSVHSPPRQRGTLQQAGSSTLRVNDGSLPPRGPGRKESDNDSFGATLLPDEDSTQWSSPNATNRSHGGMGRLGLRRSAMLYRLLCKVPEEALQRELQDCGVSAASLDQEELIEAILHQLQ